MNDDRTSPGTLLVCVRMEIIDHPERRPQPEAITYESDRGKKREGES